jgi:hypothetical protein
MKYTKRGSVRLACLYAMHRRKGNPERPPGIEGVEMRNSYYNRMSALAVTIPLAGVLLSAVSILAQNGLRGAAVESHEGLTISATPWTEAAKYKEKFPKKSPYAAGIIAVQVALRNDSDDSITVELSRIRMTVRLDRENTQELPSLSAEDVAQGVLKPGAKDPTKRSRIPLPVPVPRGNSDKNFAELQRQAQEASVPTGVVAPHSTVQGLLYFDLQSQFDLLETAHLYVPELAFLKGNRPLTYFDIDLGQRSGQ